MYPVGIASPKSLLDLALEAESLGFYAVWGNDHITTQRYLKRLEPKPRFFEPLTVFSYIAARTERLRLGTAVIVAPLRNPVILAKQAATLDNLSGGRLLLGLGIGAYREEFEAIHGRGRRGDILEETVKALRLLFEEERASFEGRYVRFTDIELNPKPVQRPMPIYLGGNAERVVERVARLGDGWVPAAVTPEEIARAREVIARVGREAGRDTSGVEIAPEFACSIDKNREEARKRFVSSPMFEHLVSLQRSTLSYVSDMSVESLEARNFVGTPDMLIERVSRYRDAGADHLWFNFLGHTYSEVVDGMRMFSREVMPSF